MKKLILLALIGVSIASCRKDRTCTCTESSDAPGSTTSTYVTVHYDAKKRNARKECQSYTEKYTSVGSTPYTYTYNCELK
jgi:hypothetical protein